MARNKQNSVNIDNQDPANYPNGRIRNNNGTNNGTPVNEFIYGDIHEFFAKLMRDSGTNYNGLPDNVNNGYQLVDALYQIPNKNNIAHLITVSSGGVLNIPVKLGKMKPFEVIFCTAGVVYNGQTSITGIDGVSKTLTMWTGDTFFNNDIVMLTLSSSGINLNARRIHTRVINCRVSGIKSSTSNVNQLTWSNNVTSVVMEKLTNSGTNFFAFSVFLAENMVAGQNSILRTHAEVNHVQLSDAVGTNFNVAAKLVQNNRILLIVNDLGSIKPMDINVKFEIILAKT